MMYEALRERAAQGTPIRVALVGAGSMGLGISWQLAHSPGFQLVSVTDIDLTAALAAAQAYGADFRVVGPSDALPPPGTVIVSREPFFLFDRPELALDVLVEATNTIGFAAQVSLAAIEQHINVVLMNAEVDLVLGPLLHRRADEHGVIVTSDAGDQHGVLLRMIDEIRVWAFRVVMAGNIKGFLNRYATAELLLREAAIRHLNPIQCCAYTDGTKLGVEMALVANATGLVPWVRGMEGPAANDVHEVAELFDFDKYGEQGVVDYILGAQPGGGVFVVGYCGDPLQQRYLSYYKMGDGPYYLFYRPYHLCHLETPWAIGQALLYRRPILRPTCGRVADVYAYAKRDIAPGELVPHAIGGDQFYGLVCRCDDAEAEGLVPIGLLEASNGQMPRLERRLERDQPLTRDDVWMPQTPLGSLFREQQQMVAAGVGQTGGRSVD